MCKWWCSIMSDGCMCDFIAPANWSKLSASMNSICRDTQPPYEISEFVDKENRTKLVCIPINIIEYYLFYKYLHYKITNSLISHWRFLRIKTEISSFFGGILFHYSISKQPQYFYFCLFFYTQYTTVGKLTFFGNISIVTRIYSRLVKVQEHHAIFRTSRLMGVTNTFHTSFVSRTSSSLERSKNFKTMIFRIY